MSDTTSTTETPTIDGVALGRWMDRVGLSGSGAPDLAFISGGTQNEIYEVRRGEMRAALRIPPPPAPASRDDGILREWRIIEAPDGIVLDRNRFHSVFSS